MTIGLPSQLWYDAKFQQSFFANAVLLNPSVSQLMPLFGRVSQILTCQSTSFMLTNLAAYHGSGKHGGDPTFFLHVFYFDEIWYCTGIFLTKISVLCFYYRIFAITRSLRLALWIVGGWVIGWWIALTSASIAQCSPIPRYWNRKIEGICVYQYGFFFGQAIPNIVLDFAFLLLPIVPLWKLKMQRHQKWALLAVFLLGYTNPLISILRIVSFIQLGPNTAIDINYNFIPPALWSAAEVSVAIFSCSIPSLTYLFRRTVGRLYPSHTASLDDSQKINQRVDGVKPATFGSLPTRRPLKLQTEGTFERLDDMNASEVELSILRSTARPAVCGGKNSESDLHSINQRPTDIQVTNDVEISYK
ncbi:hypothetical protein OCU04_008191 [Sclerotinia nivalis]|uniref:Rhodopsin domain-containing protein n=1 Tax=Sclerotinia nivalis TaxID=352851 RepID=A0A9X0DHD9_9HELO|nr:hypothetical protein OCU04_008191 [Sclerotinia nivalis]